TATEGDEDAAALGRHPGDVRARGVGDAHAPVAKLLCAKCLPVHGDGVAFGGDAARPALISEIHERPQVPSVSNGLGKAFASAPAADARGVSASAAAATASAGAGSLRLARKRSMTPDSSVVVSKWPARRSSLRVRARRKSRLVTAPCTTVS